MACPICGARTSGKCQRCRTEERLEREDRERRESGGKTGWDMLAEDDDD